MDASNKPKRGTPETEVEPKGKAGRPKIKYVDLRTEAEKRESDEIPEENQKKEEQEREQKQRKETNKNRSKNGKRSNKHSRRRC